MTSTEANEDAIAKVIDSARHLGVEIDETEAAQWMAAMAAEAAGSGDIVVDVDTGVFGHRASMLDLDPVDLARFRRIAPIVGFQDRPGVKTALALSGSSAQSKIQAYPADADFFERVHITAPTREEACRMLGELMRDKAIETMSGPTHRLTAVKLGVWDAEVTKDGKPHKPGHWVEWTPQEVQSGVMNVVAADGSARTLSWDEAAQNPGWCKLDWVVADRERGQLANASNVLDPTWEKPDGSIVPLDGFLDPYFQEIYIDTDARPVFDRIIRDISSDAVEEYVKQLNHEVWKYSVKDPNWGKVARRLYNIFRISGHYAAAAYIRELFDEPTTALYQLAALIRTLDEAAESGSPFDPEVLVQQADALIMSAITAMEGPQEAEVVSQLLRLRDELSGRKPGDRSDEVEALRKETMDAVNGYFRERLMALPEIAEYLNGIAASDQQY